MVSNRTKQILLYVVGIAIANILLQLNAIPPIPEEVYIGGIVLLIVWFSLNTINDLNETIPEIPLPLLILSVGGTIYFTTLHIVNNSALTFDLVGSVIGIIFGTATGLLIWLSISTIVSAVTMSILGIDPSENRQKNKSEKVNDPFGDKYAAKILNENENENGNK